MVLEKKWLFFIGNGAEIRPLEMGRKSPAYISPPLQQLFFLTLSVLN